MNFLKIVASLLLLVSTCLSSPLHLRGVMQTFVMIVIVI